MQSWRGAVFAGPSPTLRCPSTFGNRRGLFLADPGCSEGRLWTLGLIRSVGHTPVHCRRRKRCKGPQGITHPCTSHVAEGGEGPESPCRKHRDGQPPPNPNLRSEPQLTLSSIRVACGPRSPARPWRHQTRGEGDKARRRGTRPPAVQCWAGCAARQPGVTEHRARGWAPSCPPALLPEGPQGVGGAAQGGEAARAVVRAAHTEHKRSVMEQVRV